MDESFFRTQIARFRSRFGDKAFDNEFAKLVAREVYDISEQDFLRVVDVMIGSRKHTDAPRLAEFREARIACDKRRFESEVRGAANVLEHPARFDGLRKFLAKDYPGAKKLNEAVEIQKLRNAIARSNKSEDPA